MSFEQFWVTKLSPLVERDSYIREAIQRRGDLADRYWPELEKVHLENSRKLQSLMDAHGFPTLSSAGEHGVRLAWLIIQHAIPNPSFMRDALVNVRLAVAQNDYPPELLAYLEDRVAYLEGRLQIFGTNLDWDNGELTPTPIEDPAGVDHRRRALNLCPLCEADRGGHEAPPRNPEAKAQEFDLWVRRVGWRS